MWVANLYYWGFNQYIIQRTLAAKSLKEAQRGIALAAFLKLIIPLIVVIPGALLEGSARDLEVINAGVGAYGTVQEYLYLREEGLRFDPDLVLLMFYANDLVDNCIACYPGIGPRPHATIEGGRIHIVEDFEDDAYLEFCMPAPFRSLLLRHCYIYRSLNKNLYQRIHAERLWQLECRNAEAVDPNRRRALFFELLARMQDLVAAKSAHLAVALIPTREEVRAGQSEEQEAILRHCAARDLPALSLLPALRAATAAGTRAYFDRDIHLTRDGHRVVAEALGTFVEKLRR